MYVYLLFKSKTQTDNKDHIVQTKNTELSTKYYIIAINGLCRLAVRHLRILIRFSYVFTCFQKFLSCFLSPAAVGLTIPNPEGHSLTLT